MVRVVSAVLVTARGAAADGQVAGLRFEMGEIVVRDVIITLPSSHSGLSLAGTFLIGVVVVHVEVPLLSPRAVLGHFGGFLEGEAQFAEDVVVRAEDEVEGFLAGFVGGVVLGSQVADAVLDRVSEEAGGFGSFEAVQTSDIVFVFGFDIQSLSLSVSTCLG